MKSEQVYRRVLQKIGDGTTLNDDYRVINNDKNGNFEIKFDSTIIIPRIASFENDKLTNIEKKG